MKLIPKTHRGKNKIREAGTDQWRIICDWDQVACLEDRGGMLIEPILNEDHGFAFAKRRWIRRVNDPNFDWQKS